MLVYREAAARDAAFLSAARCRRANMVRGEAEAEKEGQ
jgi:hypothetical protein